MRRTVRDSCFRMRAGLAGHRMLVTLAPEESTRL